MKPCKFILGWRVPVTLVLAITLGLVRGRAATESTDEMVKALSTRVEQLEKEIKELKGDVAAGTAENPGEETQTSYPRVRLNGFADVNFHSSNAPDVHPHFEIGEFDLFIKAQISERANFLAETVIASDEHNNWGLDVERILFNYSVSPYFNVGLGRYHTALGYYNNTFHHGTWFQTTVDRPSFLRFEDEGGLLPIHNTGVTINGIIPSGQLGLHYNVEVGNGRSYAASTSVDNQVQNVSDNNDHKAVNLAVAVRPEFAPGLQLGTGLYLDRLRPEGLRDTGESIWHNFLVYRDAQWEYLSEYYVVRHKPDGGGPAASSDLWFAQVGRQFGPFRPYFRYTSIHVPASDVAYALITTPGRRTGLGYGVRWDFETYAAIKAQYDVVNVSDGPNEDDFVLQLALSF